MNVNRRSFIVGLSGAAALGAVDVGRPDYFISATAQGDARRVNAEALRNRISGDREFQLLARDWDARLRLDVGNESFEMTVQQGKVADIRPAPTNSPADVTLSGPAQAWTEGVGLRGLKVTGDDVKQVWPFYAALFRLTTLVRESVTGPVQQPPTRDVDRPFDSAVGRYVYVRIQGVQHRIFIEEAGRGVPILLQHTAGADGREWRFMLEDSELQQHFRMIAYDLPYHGRSIPPTATDWWAQEYRLTRDRLLDSVVALSRAINADGGVFLGCALGGDLALDLAVYRPEAFTSVIGINGSLGGTSDVARVEASNASYAHPRVFNSRRVGMMVYGNTSAQAPESHRREVQWIYGQSAPGVIGGDFYYYSIDHHLTVDQIRKIDTATVSVHLMTGEYGPDSGPNGMAAVAAQIPGATYSLIKGAGYLPMTDDYPRLREALRPVLEEVLRKRDSR